MNWAERFFRWLGRISGVGEDVDPNRIVNQTQRFNLTLFTVAVVAIAAIVVSGIIKQGAIQQITWGLIGAFASAAVGAALGVLFGLPSVEAKRAALNATQPPIVPAGTPGATSALPAREGSTSPLGPDGSTSVVEFQQELDFGYRDSTSLEQVADWLTKIIVGLTLTQYGIWEDRFQTLASNLTAAMLTRSPECARIIGDLNGPARLQALGLPACLPSPIPGGVVIVLFATSGFLATYLWMRRYFVVEMIMAKRQAIRVFRAEAKVAVAKEKKAEEQRIIDAAGTAGLAQPSPVRAMIASSVTELSQIFDRASKRLIPASPAANTLAAIRTQVEKQADPEDPWRGKFGPSSATGFTLEASVTPTAHPQYFKVDLKLRAQSPGFAAEAAGSRVMYFLHPTFIDQPKISTFGSDGIAPLELYAYGAFTVGALLLENGLALELNLATLPDAPQGFLTQ